ncbi:rhomboid family intramembrane serine protease [Oleiharenicola lentus]|jgi:membrane associated rhomboid family serine protease|uniref:Rhomboid family intramembrane serine protease n=1 Tax=Oleiharenicola lentus TaxID=2508720 RepID=A0A4Q1C8W5_9BACT|nr:rhomboid family intramembrane serine protease [Oleiharenicola lentus]RXK55404.1 rhomboid family intramembrane serine protease [Oleiharenicola lentus]
MIRFDPSDQTRPVLHIGEYPLYSPHVIVLGYVLSMLVTTTCLALRVSAPFEWLPFTATEVLRGQVWRVFTYGLVNAPSLWFVIDMFMLVWFGREVEKFFGRRIFLQLYAGLYLLTPVLFTVLGLFGWKQSISGQTGSFGVFIAFATLYPSAPFFFNILAKWLAWVLVAIYSLIHLANRDLPSLLSLWAGAGFAHGYVRYEQGRFTLPKIPNPFARLRGPKFKVLPGQAPEKPRTAAPITAQGMADVDALLDKIARSGIHSLTPEERAQLDRSSAELMKRKGGAPRSR